MSEAVDRFVETKVPPHLREVAERLREIVRERVPDAREEIGYGIPVWKRNRTLAVMNPTKTAITLAFSRGADLDDPRGLLRGVGKVSKHIKLKSAAEIPEEALRRLLDQAVALDDRRG